jgi:uncharacterized membrane protein
VYPLIIAAAYMFVVKERSVVKGAVFGLVVYGVYNLTNRALLANYPWSLVVTDTAWGVFIFSLIGYMSSMRKTK